MKKVFVLLVVIILTLGIVGCDSTPEYLGEWETFYLKDRNGGFIEITEDYVYNLDGNVRDYTVDGDKILINGIQVIPLEYSVEEDVLSLKSIKEGSVKKFLRADVFEPNDSLIDEVVGIWSSEDNRILNISDDFTLYINNSNKLNFKINKDYIKLTDTLEYIPYRIEGDKLVVEFYGEDFILSEISFEEMPEDIKEAIEKE